MSRSLSPRRVKSEAEAFDTPTKRGTKKEDGLLTPKSVKSGKEKLTPGKDKETVLIHSFAHLLALSSSNSLICLLVTALTRLLFTDILHSFINN